MESNYEQLIQEVLNLVNKRGKNQAEVYLTDAQEMSIEVADRQVENMKLAQERGLGLRVVVDNRLGYAFTSDLARDSLEKVVEKALQTARQSEPDSNWELPMPYDNYSSLDLYDEEIFRVPVEEKINIALQIEEAAKGVDKRIKITEKAVYNDSRYGTWLYNNRGLQGYYQASYCGGYGLVVGQEKEDSQIGFSMRYHQKYGDLDPVVIGKEAGEKAVRMLGAKTIPSGRLPVILEPHTAVGILGILQTVFSADALLKGKSFLENKLGQIVASPLITIIDDGTLAGKLGSSPFDDEGVPTARTTLLQAGKLEGFLHNTYTARRYWVGSQGQEEVKSTGNSVRASFKGTPEVGPTNFFIERGLSTQDQLISDINKGIFITELMGLHTANPITGNFSLGAAGLFIQNGKLTTPFKGVAVAGNLQELLLDIEGVGDDLTFFISKGSPTIRIKSMSVSGT